MYGMMPSAKIEKRDSAPPENMLNMSRMPPRCCLNSSASTHWIDARHRDERRRCGRRSARPAGTAAGASDRRACRTRAGSRWPSLLSLRRGSRGVLASSLPAGAASGGSSTLPPAASIAARAPLVTAMPLQRDLALDLAGEDHLCARARVCGTRPAALSAARSIVVDLRALCRSPRRTSAVSSRVSETKPRFGRRRCSGIWPPSKPTLWKPPARAFWPLWPRPAVLPRPQPMPRPTRFFAAWSRLPASPC